MEGGDGVEMEKPCLSPWEGSSGLQKEPSHPGVKDSGTGCL